MEQRNSTVVEGIMDTFRRLHCQKLGLYNNSCGLLGLCKKNNFVNATRVSPVVLCFLEKSICEKTTMITKAL